MNIYQVIAQAKEKGYTHVDASGSSVETIENFEESVMKKDKFYSPLYNLTYNNIQDDKDGGRVYSIGQDSPAVIFYTKGWKGVV